MHENRYNKHVNILLFFTGISNTFDRAISISLGDKLSLSTILIMCTLAGGLLGWVSYYIYPALISWTGSWIEGKSNTVSILRVIAYAMKPSVFALVLLLLQISLYRIKLFQSGSTLEGDDLISIIVFMFL